MSPRPPFPKLPPMPPSPIKPLREIVRQSRQQVEKARDDIHSLASELRSAASLKAPETPKGAPSEQKPMVTPQEPEKGPPRAATEVVTRQGLDPETMRWQLQETRAELWELEGHLKNKCLDCGTPPTCCIKHALNLADLARETKSMTTDPLWDDIITLAEEVKNKCHPDLIMAETYFDELPALVIKTSALRRQVEDQVIKNLKPELTLDEAKKLAAEEAAKEVEERWH